MNRSLPAIAVLLGTLFLSGCAIPSSHDTVAATQDLVARQSSVGFEWRRTAVADAQALSSIDPLLAQGISAQQSIAVAFLASPELQLALERLEISRSELVAASTPPNPVLVAGVRESGGSLAAFYPGRTFSVGVLQNVLALLNMPARHRVASQELERTRLDTADRIIGLAAEVNQAYVEYIAAQHILALRERSAAASRAALDTLVVDVANGKGATALDLALERNAVYGAEGSLVRARLDVSTLRAKLGQLMGIAGLRDDWQTSGELQPLPQSDPDLKQLETQALERRLDIRAAREAVLARLKTLATQRRFRWLGGLELGVFRESTSGGTSFTGPNVVLELPVFDQRQSQLLAADAELRTAQRHVEVLVQTMRNELRTHAAELAATRALSEQYRDLVLPNQHQIQAQLGTDGEPGSIERQHLRLASLASEEDGVGLLRDYWRARGALARAAGDWEGLGGASEAEPPAPLKAPAAGSR
jgi:cobalt-zinc-cadmium efflux system outer membrane protein